MTYLITTLVKGVFRQLFLQEQEITDLKLFHMKTLISRGTESGKI